MKSKARSSVVAGIFVKKPPRLPVSGGRGQACICYEIRDRNGNVVSRGRALNIQTQENCHRILEVYYRSGTQITDWKIVPIENDYSPAGTETYATPGATECTAYDEAERQAFSPAAAADNAISSQGAMASITMNAAKTLYGVMIVGGGTGAATKGDTAGGGVLACIAKFTAGEAVQSGYEIKLWAEISQNDDGA